MNFSNKMKLINLFLLLAGGSSAINIAIADTVVVEDRSIRLDSDTKGIVNNNLSNSSNKLESNIKTDNNHIDNLSRFKSSTQTNNQVNNQSNLTTVQNNNKTNNWGLTSSDKLAFNQQSEITDSYNSLPLANAKSNEKSNTNTVVSYKKPISEQQYPDNDINFDMVASFDEIDATDDSKERERILKELDSLPMNARMQRLENIIETQKSLHLDNKFRALQTEIQRLRGELEAERHKLEKSIAQQKLLYDDLDRRFSQVDSSSNTDSSNTAASQINYHDEKLAQQDLYTKAYKKIKSRDYEQAIRLFNEYLDKYPKGLFGANANYWLGEIYMIQSEYEKALSAFDTVLTKYPTNPKSADALYKKGLVQIYTKDFEKAKVTLVEVKKKYKNTTAARLADKQLQSIENINNDA